MVFLYMLVMAIATILITGQGLKMTTKHFECEECGARGKIVLKSENQADECVYCPVCSADIYEEEELDEEE